MSAKKSLIRSAVNTLESGLEFIGFAYYGINAFHIEAMLFLDLPIDSLA